MKSKTAVKLVIVVAPPLLFFALAMATKVDAAQSTA